MSSLAAGASSTILELKGSSLTALALVLRSNDLSDLARELNQRLGDTPDAFANDPVVIDLTAIASKSHATAGATPRRASGVIDDLFSPDPAARSSEAQGLDLAALAALLKRHGLQAVAVRGGNASQTAAALALGLADAAPVRPEPRASKSARGTNNAAAAAPEPAVREVVREVIREVEVIREIPAPTPKTVVIDKPLRSGQQVYAKGADLVVLALVNHGAEVIADGNIHVYAPLRGKAIAGARGNTDARIYANCLEAELLAIAGIYRTTEEPLPANVLGQAACVRLDGEKLIMEPLGE